METMLPVVRIDFEKAHCDNVANESVTLYFLILYYITYFLSQAVYCFIHPSRQY